MAELVIADASFKKYPGFVVAVKCSDWLASGTSATVETDSLACTGEAVRETQQISIAPDPFTTYTDAVDTLEIVNPPLNPDLHYEVYVSCRIEGYLDVTNGDLLQASSHESYFGAYVVGLHGGDETEDSPIYEHVMMPELPHYRLIKINGAVQLETPGSLFIRAFAESGTTIEILLDQIVFLPVSPIPNGRVFDLQSMNSPFNLLPVVDGADGGDDAGKFTLTPAFVTPVHNYPADYQRKADAASAEWAGRIIHDDNFAMWFANPESEGPAWMYSKHCAKYNGERTWVEDTFDNRDTSGAAPTNDFGISPDGCGYAIGGSSGGVGPNEAHVDGTKGILRVGHFMGVVQTHLGSSLQGPDADENQGIRLPLWDQWSFVGIFEAVTVNQSEDCYLTIDPPQPTPGLDLGSLSLSLPGKVAFISKPDTTFSTIDLSSWFDMGVEFGIRLEVRRYVARWRIWDTSGAEPSTWDDEYFLFSGIDPYPYGDDLLVSRQVTVPFDGVIIGLVETLRDTAPLVYPIEVEIHNVKIEHDPYGTPADMTVRIEEPEGELVDEIVIPFGAEYLVYWGKRDWTEYNVDDDEYYLEFSVKLWNDTGAAEQQRAEADFFYFYWLRQGAIDLSRIRFRAWQDPDQDPEFEDGE